MKFRIYSNDTKKFVYGPNKQFLIQLNGDVVDGNGCHYDEVYKVYPWTGLSDHSGVEIYEGDVLAYPEGDFGLGRDGRDDRMIVYYDRKLARFGLKFQSVHGGEGYTGSVENIHTYVRDGACVIGHIFNT